MKKTIISSLILLLSFILIILSFNFIKIDKKIKINFKQYKILNENFNILTVVNDNQIKKYNFKIYKNKKLISNITTTKNNINIISDKIKLHDKLEVVITLKNNFISKKIKSYFITINENLEKVAPITSNYSSGEISGRKYLELKTITDNAFIYYTTNRELPTTKSILYKEPIKLDKDMFLTIVAISNDYLNSDYKILNFKVKDTTPIIYVSPSLQDENNGVSNTGYSTEEAMMNKVADAVVPVLKKAGFIVYRNNIKMNLTECVNDSKKRNVDLHLALHSNAAGGKYSGKYTGIETWKYDNNNKIVNEIAKRLQNNIMNVYYNKNKNRGVKNSIDIGGLRETNPLKVDNGILIEIGFHDNYSDAIWISNNVKNIGENIAKTLIDYYHDTKF